MTSTAESRAGRREWIGLAVLAIACLLYSMDLTVLHLAVPSISAQLQPSSAQLLWIIDIYGFMVAGFLITMGTLGDRIGRRRLLLAGATAFGAASLLAAFSTSAEMLILSRALMGIAGATLAPSTLSLIFNMFRDARQRSTAIVSGSPPSLPVAPSARCSAVCSWSASGGAPSSCSRCR
jgi:DHA2 family multidrug resistance protein-like MFS transporter